MAVVRMPDGQLARFPDEMSREDIKAFVAQKYPNAYDTQKQGTQTRGERALNSLKRDLQDIAYGAKKAVSGATLGASDWALRKLGVNDEAYLQDRGLPAKGAGLVAELGGNIMGAGGAITKALANRGLKGLGLMTADAGLQGAAYGATSSDRLSDLPVNVAAGGAVGAATGGALGVAGRAIKRLVPSLNVIGKKSGLENALDDIETLRAINRGSRASDEVAQGVLNRAQGVKGSLNDEMANALGRARGSELDIQNAIDTQQKRLGKYVAKNADKELFSLKSPEEQAQQNFKRWFEGSQVVDESGQPLKLYHGTDADFDAFDMSKGRSTMDIQGAFFSPYDLDARGYGSNLKEVYLNVKNPADEQTAYRALRKYQGQNDAGLKAKQDLQRQGFDGVFNGYDEYIAFEPNQIKSVNNSGAWSSSPSLSDAGWKPTTPISNYTQGLTDFQVDALNKALAEGASKSTTPLGTLGATHRGQEVLNDMIEASFDKSIIGTKRPTTDTRQLMGLKERFNQILEPSGVKPYDISYSKAQALRTNFEKGYNFKPSETKFESLGLEKARDKRAFLQGRISKILDDVTDDQSVATLIKKDQNTLKKLMTPKKFETLMKTADKIEGNYRNLKNLETTANSALRRSSDASRPLSEKMESFTSMIGSALDRLLGGIYRRSDVATARRILSGQPIPQNSILLNNLRNSTPAVSGIMVEELLKN